MNSDNKTFLPEPTLRRLPWYLAYIDMLRSDEVPTVSTTQIANALSVDASQIAKDLSFLNIKGKTRIGYDVKMLGDALISFLGFKSAHNAVIVGVGSLGGALLQDDGLKNYGLHIVAGFDTDEQKIGSSSGDVTIYNIDDMRRICKAMRASIGILTVPADKAQECADRLVGCGIKAIWNFTPYRIHVREGIVLSNTSIYANLALIYNRLETGVSSHI